MKSRGRDGGGHKGKRQKKTKGHKYPYETLKAGRSVHASQSVMHTEPWPCTWEVHQKASKHRRSKRPRVSFRISRQRRWSALLYGALLFSFFLSSFFLRPRMSEFHPSLIPQVCWRWRQSRQALCLRRQCGRELGRGVKARQLERGCVRGERCGVGSA